MLKVFQNTFQNTFLTPFGRAFSPSDDALAFAHYDASDTSTIADTADVVTQWNDKIGSNDLSAITGTPTTNTRTENGLNVIDFDGAEFIASGASFPLPASGNLAVHFVSVIDAIDNSNDCLMSMNAAANDWQLQAQSATQFDGRLNTDSNGNLDLTGGPYSGVGVWSIVFNFSSSTFDVFKDGVSVVTPGTYSVQLATLQTMMLMSNRPAGNFVDGAFCEAIFTEDVTTNSLVLYVDYLTNKWT